MKTLTVEEAVAGLPGWLDRVLAGERIQISKGGAVIELRSAQNSAALAAISSASRDALRLLQRDARLSAAEAESYLEEIRSERLAAEVHR
jgi:antitoxin (DNA-binding transcriptional repressor) of toxin-antitoxin stability system